MLVDEKIKQAIQILQELRIDMWMTFVRELSTLSDPRSEFYLGTGCTWPSAFIITAGGDTIAIVGSLDAANIESHGHYKRVISYKDSIKKVLLNTIQQLDPKKIAINFSQSDVMADSLSHGMYLILVEYLTDTPYLSRLMSSETILAALRGRKSGEEISRIRKAIEKTLEIFDKVTRFIKPGLTEKQIASYIQTIMQKENLLPAWEPTQCPAVFTGPESAGADPRQARDFPSDGCVLQEISGSYACSER